MPFITDRDLLAYEPALARDLPLPGQDVLRVTDAAINGTTLTSDSSDFVARNIDAGHIATVNNAPVEIISRQSATALTLSRIRATTDDATLPPGNGEGVTLIVRTYRPQIQAVHDALLVRLGVDTDASSLSASEIVSLALMRRLEVLAALERVFTAASAVSGDNAELKHKAAYYRRRFDDLCREARIAFDTDGDGTPDLIRHLGVVPLNRV